ncbi:RNA-binding S4 domain-containing protein [Agromyces subbeticus]|uniref:RNA-binding S4 domain-containing protein n=1 Tax=Agromyces subbeticus TaxID=293890 RepID=UPI0003B402C4|nr:RNA-binding S4 domain-containing protein [Agromyces subbeticus]
MASTHPIDDVPIGGDGIRLGQFLKFAGLLDSGGDAKELIVDGFVSVNGEVERRRGRQLHEGDLVTCQGRTVRVRREEPAAP